MMAEHLIHVGFAKAGCTYFKAWCMRHPEIGFAHDGFAGFPAPRDVPGESTDQQLKLRVTSSERIVSFSTPAEMTAASESISLYNSLLKEKRAQTARVLKEIYPDAHILILTRSWRDSIAPTYSQLLKSDGLWEGGSNNHSDFSEWSENNRLSHVAFMNYADVFKIYAEVFGQDRVLLLPFELLRKSPSAFTGLIADRFGLENPNLGIGRVNPSYSAAGCARIAYFQRKLFSVMSPTRATTRGIARRVRLWLEAHGHRIGLGLFDGPPLTCPENLSFDTPETREFRSMVQDNPIYAPFLPDYFTDVSEKSTR